MSTALNLVELSEEKKKNQFFNEEKLSKTRATSSEHEMREIVIKLQNQERKRKQK